MFCRNERPELADLGTLPDFAFTDERGQPFTQEALRGQVTVIDFIFTRCDQICPVVTQRMRGVQDKTFDAGKRLKFVSITVDPGYDTPERLAAYARENGADDARWRFLTGPADQIRAIVEGPLMNSMRLEREINSIPQIGHTGHFVLVDGDLRIRGVYGSSDVTKLDELMRDARYLIRTRRRD
ncbi:MAG: SCO family protein [Deltaproteobacteria bacterium]|nr:SCO family protein [Deltaproteobacteria bacterium]